MRLTRAERTTTINYDEEGDVAEVITYSVSLISSLRKNKSATEVQQYPGDGVRFQIPKKLVSFRSGTVQRRKLTEEEREAARERLASARRMKGRKLV